MSPMGKGAETVVCAPAHGTSWTGAAAGCGSAGEPGFGDCGVMSRLGGQPARLASRSWTAASAPLGLLLPWYLA